MIKASEISLFSLEVQLKLLNKYGKYVLEEQIGNLLILQLFELNNCFFHVYLDKEQKTVKKIIPFDHNVLI